MLRRYARRIGTYKGRALYRIPARIVFNNSGGRLSDWLSPPVVEMEVIAQSAAQAANWARDNEVPPGVAEVEIHAWGVNGGHIQRFIGWESAMASLMLTAPAQSAQLF